MVLSLKLPVRRYFPLPLPFVTLKDSKVSWFSLCPSFIDEDNFEERSVSLWLFSDCILSVLSFLVTCFPDTLGSNISILSGLVPCPSFLALCLCGPVGYLG